MSHVIEFDTDGAAQAMHSDKFPLSILGSQEIVRATDIRFNAQTQRWGIHFPVEPGSDVFESAPAHNADKYSTYDGAREVEVEWLNTCRLYGYDPRGVKGMLILSILNARRGL